MKHLITIIFFLFITGCSVQVVNMSEKPTEQVYDLTDTDSDGVILARDMCPDTFNGAKVDNKGCGVDKLKHIRYELKVNFDSNSFFVKPAFYPEIKNLADVMKEYPSSTVLIEGHTSKVGSKALNKKLSLNRAKAVKDILVKRFAIDDKRISVIGYGSEHLLVEGDAPQIHAQNRRIITDISSDKQIKDMKWTIYSVDQSAQ